MKKSQVHLTQKGFYIALSLCIVAVFFTAYILTGKQNTEQGESDFDTQSVMNEPQTPVLPTPTATALPQSTQAPRATAASKAKETEPQDNQTAATTVNSEPTTLTMPTEGSIAVAHTQDTLVYSKTYEDWRTHSGIDINCEKGTAVKAVADGTVEKIYTDPLKGIVIELSHGTMRSVYANLSTDSMVKVGDKVHAGDIISGVGDSAVFESQQQPHLHFELFQGETAVDPMQWIQT